MLESNNIHYEYLHIEQQKTGIKLLIPLALALDSLGLVLGDTLLKCKKRLVGETVISSTRNLPLSSGTVSRYFMRARKASGLSLGDSLPTFHELRSLSTKEYGKRICDKLAQHLLGYKSESMTAQGVMIEEGNGTSQKSGNDFILTDSDLCILII